MLGSPRALGVLLQSRPSPRISRPLLYQSKCCFAFKLCSFSGLGFPGPLVFFLHGEGFSLVSTPGCCKAARLTICIFTASPLRSPSTLNCQLSLLWFCFPAVSGYYLSPCPPLSSPLGIPVPSDTPPFPCGSTLSSCPLITLLSLADPLPAQRLHAEAAVLSQTCHD